MSINRFTNIVFGMAIAITTQPFFGMEPKPAVCAAASADGATDDTQSPRHGIMTLIDACERGDFPLVKSIIKATPTLINASLSHLTPLQEAVHHNRFEIATYLLAQGAAVNAKGSIGRTPLHYAAHDTNMVMVELLLAHNALIDPLDDLGVTPLHYAAVKNNFSIINALVASGANVNSCDENRWAPLHYAALHNNVAAAALLLAYGANIHAKTERDYTALHALGTPTAHDMAQLLIHCGANVNEDDDVGLTPLHYAANNDDFATIKLLISHGANIYKKDNHNLLTALDIAIVRNKREIINHLADKMAAQPTLHALLACDELIIDKTDAIPHGEFPPEDIDRILRPVIAAALSGK